VLSGKLVAELPIAMRDWRLVICRSLELDTDLVLLDLADPAVSNRAVVFRHDLKAAGYVDGVGYIDGRAFVGKVYDPAARARSSNGNEGNFVDFSPVRPSSVITLCR